MLYVQYRGNSINAMHPLHDRRTDSTDSTALFAGSVTTVKLHDVTPTGCVDCSYRFMLVVPATD
ncbi:unnamed protein product [Sphacelaria rigidula]